MSWWIWVLIAFALLAVEFATTTMHVGVFAIGALAVALLAAAGVHLPLSGELIVFTGISLAAFVFLRPVLVRRLTQAKPKEIDPLVGEHAVVLGDIAIAGVGKAEMRGSVWSARNVGERPLATGERCIVASVEGLELRITAEG